MTIQEILTKSGRTCAGDNRSRAIKGCNIALNNGITIQLAEYKKIYTRGSDGFKWNIKVIGHGYKRLHQAPIHFGVYDVLSVIALFLQAEGVRENMGLNVQSETECGKCNGTGNIPAFAWYANGVCFDCMGAGRSGKFGISKKLNK